MATFLTTFQLILGYVTGVFLPQHISTFAWTVYCEDVGKFGLQNVVRNCPDLDLDFADVVVIFA